MKKVQRPLLMLVTSRRQLFDLSDDMAKKFDIQFCSDVREPSGGLGFNAPERSPAL
ncbi:hypothetical protein [Methanosarcina sp. 1.H.T.1A.1]|uniref:hypothetical protein n=1 Tax=Methanosarcina sp. 1.H.T.1A.1 TaxID=1483602 RepID=UPI000A645050|nr:hypothetical protein [Methanosarcina sp. 1.H.T.1A.1]